MPADPVYVKVHGLEELERALNELPEKMAKTALRLATRKTSQQLQKVAQSNVQVRRGTLQQNIGVSVRAKSEGVRGSTIVARIGIRSKVFYGRFLEHGTKKMSRIPWLLPAFESLRSTIIETFKEELASAIRKVRLKKRFV